MEVERKTLVEIVVSVGSVAAFIAALVFVGVSFNDGGLSSTGALALIGVMAAFIILMTGVGYWLSGRDF